MAFIFTLPLRVTQASLGFIVLVLSAYVSNHWTWGGAWSPAPVNFLIFCAVWTLLALAYLVVAPWRFPDAAHKLGILAVEVVTTIFWFAGWVSLASLLGDIGLGRWAVGHAATAACVFAAFEWCVSLPLGDLTLTAQRLCFCASTIMASLHCWRTRRDGSGKHDPAMEVHRDPRV